MEPITLVIPKHNKDDFLKKCAKIEKRAVRNGFEFTLEAGKPYALPHPNAKAAKEGAVISVEKYTITGGAPKLEGYIFRGALDFASILGSVIVKTAPDSTIPAEYHNHDGKCDHCNTRRARKLVAILEQESTGKHFAVGSNCSRDFIGYDIEQAAWYLQSLWDFAEYGRELWNPDQVTGWNVEDAEHSTKYVATVTAALIRCDGWLSKAASNEDTPAPTSSMAIYFIFPQKFFGRTAEQDYAEHEAWKKRVAPTAADKETAELAMAWIVEQDNSNSYIHNLQAIAEAGCVPKSLYGYWCSVVSSYLKAMERLDSAKKEKALIINEHFGTVGKRDALTVTVKRKHTTWGTYGTTYIVGMLTSEGHSLVWFGSSETAENMEKGEQYQIKATVKKHDEYNDIAQTTVTRVALVA